MASPLLQYETRLSRLGLVAARPATQLHIGTRHTVALHRLRVPLRGVGELDSIPEPGSQGGTAGTGDR